MHLCELDLGPDPWPRLAEGSVTGRLSWNRGPDLPVSVRIRGAHSRKFPKRSLQVTLRGARLPDEPPAGHAVRRVHLNADFVDPTLLRSALCYSLFPIMGVDAPRWRHVHLIVSGEPAGLYVALESVDDDFCRRRNWIPGPMFYAVNRNANLGLISPFTRTLKEPLERGYFALGGADPTPIREMLMAINLASAEDVPEVAARWFDLERYIHWVIGAVFVGNRDGFMHNYALYLEPTQRRFRIIPWDYDATWGIDIHGRPARLDRVPVTGWNKLSHRLFAHPHGRERFRRAFRAALDGPLAPDTVLPLVDRLSQQLERWRERDPYLAGVDFPAEVERLRRWAVDRRALLLRELDAL